MDKKITAAILSAAMIMTISSCRENSPEAGTKAPETSVTTPVETTVTTTGTTAVIYDELFYGTEKAAELAVLRVDDIYLTHKWNDSDDEWKQAEGAIPPEMEIPEGTFALVKADITRLSGGIAGYMGNPQIDRLISAEPKSLEEMKEYCNIPEYVPGAETYLQPMIYGEYIIIGNGEVYNVYRGGETVVKEGTNEDVEKAIGMLREPDIGDMYYTAPSPEEILTDPGTGIKYVKDQLLISASPDAEKSEIERIVRELGAETIGYIGITNDWQIRFLHDMTIDELQKAADHLNSFPFIYNVTLNLCNEVSFE